MKYINIELPKELSKRKKLILFKVFICKKPNENDDLLDSTIVFNQDYDMYSLISHNASEEAINEYIKREKLEEKYSNNIEDIQNHIINNCEHVEFKIILNDECIYEEALVKLPHIEEKSFVYDKDTTKISYTIKDRMESVNVHFDIITALSLHYDSEKKKYIIDELKLDTLSSGIKF